MRVSGAYFGKSFSGTARPMQGDWKEVKLNKSEPLDIRVYLDRFVETISGNTYKLYLRDWVDGVDFLWGSCCEVMDVPLAYAGENIEEKLYERGDY